MAFDFQHYDACQNDETRSGILRYTDYGTIITLYDSPSGDKGDDYTEIKVLVLPLFQRKHDQVFVGESCCGRGSQDPQLRGVTDNCSGWWHRGNNTSSSQWAGRQSIKS
jgi:hypothetical protein